MEIALRSEDHMNKHSAEILSIARVMVQQALVNEWCFVYYDYLRLLGQFGNMSQEGILKEAVCRIEEELQSSSFSGCSRPYSEKLLFAATTSLELIRAREFDALRRCEQAVLQQQQADAMDVDAGTDGNLHATDDLKAVQRDDNGAQDAMPNSRSGLADGETEEGLEEVLRMSEAEAIQEEQAQLQEALLRSKVQLQEAGVAMQVSSVTVVVLQYSQSKSWFPDALMHSPDLQKERQGLVEAGLSSALPSGAKIFVAPEVFTTIVQYFEDEGWELKTSHVIVAKGLEEKVRDVVETARAAVTKRERGSCKIKDRTELSVPIDHDDVSQASATLSEDVPVYVVKRTFVHIPIPSSISSASSFHPRTV